MTLRRTMTAALLALTAARALAAQTAAGALGSVAGTVIAAASGQPVSGAVVVLESASDVSMISPASGPFLGRSLVAVTDQDGAYRFSALAPGTYRLVVRHLGFRPAVLHIDVTQPAPFRVSVALVVNPIRLEAMDTRATSTTPYGRTRSGADEMRFGRLDAEQFRDERFLEGDAAVLTHADVLEAVTLGETDLFRAVQRLPGVSTRDDFTAALWTRGAPWSETRVYFDGLPLFNPVHAIGVFAGVNPDAIGTATFHPGVRSPAIGEGAAGVLNVTSRRPSRPGLGFMGEVSLISAKAAVDWSSPGGRTTAMFAARRSYIDLVTGLAERLGADSGTAIPYSFYDLTARFDADLGGGKALEVSGLWEEDHVDDAVPGLLRPTRGQWGNHVLRTSLHAPLGRWHTRTTVGLSDFAGRLGPKPLDLRSIGAPTLGDVDIPLPQHAPMRNTVRDVVLRTELTPAGPAAAPSWSAGAQLSLQSQHFAGQFPRPYPVVVLPDSLLLNERIPIGSVWGERRWGLGRHVAMELGLRADLHRPLRNAPAVGLAPKLAVRATPPGTRVTFTAAAARSWQYTQALAPAGPSIGPDLYVTDVWLLASDTLPAVRSDVGTLGIEAWIGGGWTASVNVYARHATGVAVPEPAVGPLNNQRPIFVMSTNTASGIELSTRRLVGRWTASASYSFGRSMVENVSALTGGRYRYPSTADRRHVANITGMMRLGSGWRLGAAMTAASGAPFSRFVLGVAPCDSVNPASCPLSADTAALSIAAPNAERAPMYASLDLLVDWSRALGRVRVGAFMQLRNVLNRANAVTYAGSLQQCYRTNPPTLVATDQPGVCDRFDKGVPILPLAGVRVAF